MGRDEERFLAAYREWERASERLYVSVTLVLEGGTVDPSAVAAEQQRVRRFTKLGWS